MKFHVLTLFPEMIAQGLGQGILGKAAGKQLFTLNVVNIRDYTQERHGKVDDYPYGGGAGMLMQAQPVYDAYKAVAGGRKIRTIYVTPQGEPFTQKKARELSEEEELLFLCGHYEGIDERVLEEIVTDSVSIGDYVLTGGELPAMVMIDAIARLLPGVLGNDASAEEESFHCDLLEYPQYSRPEIWHGKQVPEVLLAGDHRKTAAWRLEQSISRTARRRPDLYEKYCKKQDIIKRLFSEKRNNIHMMEALASGRGEILYAADTGTSGEWDILVYDGESGICMMTAADETSGKMLAERIPADARWIVISQPFMKEILEKREFSDSGRTFPEDRKGKFRETALCGQMLYTPRETLSVRYKEVHRLSEKAFSYICLHYPEKEGGGEDYIRERIRAGALYGAFEEERLIGFAGVHRGGSLGMLYVEESRRGRGIGESLEAYVVNQMLGKGRTPYLYVDEKDIAMYRLQEKLGFYKARKNFLWLKKVLANGMTLC
ncbi:MAG: tRNA (guanosine(37)-N1)-methyltransferase TrmD [Lachnospiraceae bacterium]|nr:tRNA (guanosine(37)-N1)-methyltransferase TrmD [uncultured Acetatifactor sp.]MCI8287062.1 tRNA (guanosine(37)-N1)-methyltransferase TrmD [Lachnospiraceae bacterium]